MEWVLISGAGPSDPLFSLYMQFPGKLKMLKTCQGSMVTKVLKEFLLRVELDPKEFAFQSLKKSAVTQLNTHGVEREEAKARGNYFRSLAMVQTAYNLNNTSRGPSTSSGLGIGRMVGAKDVRRHMGVSYEAER